jgi:hypothetical protein
VAGVRQILAGESLADLATSPVLGGAAVVGHTHAALPL